MPPTPTDYTELLKDMIDFCGGINSEKETSVKKFHQRFPQYVEHAISDVRRASERAGGMNVRFQARLTNGKVAGKRAFWTFTHSADWIVAKAKEEWGIDPFNSAEVGRKLPPSPNYNSGQRRTGKTAAPPPVEPEKTSPVTETTPEGPLKGSERGEGWKGDLRRLRKDEIEGLLEAARQYSRREDFIAEEMRKFAEMGITIDPSAIHFERQEDMEVIVAIDEYYARLRRANERLTDQLKNMPTSSASAQRIAELREEVEELKEERRKREAATEKLITQYRTKLQDADRRIKLLQGNARQQPV